MSAFGEEGEGQSHPRGIQGILPVPAAGAGDKREDLYVPIARGAGKACVNPRASY